MSASARPRYRPLLKNGLGIIGCLALVVVLSQLWAHGVIPMTPPIAVLTLAAAAGFLWFILAYCAAATAIAAARVHAHRLGRRSGR